jgi:hypothetical protein
LATRGSCRSGAQARRFDPGPSSAISEVAGQREEHTAPLNLQAYISQPSKKSVVLSQEESLNVVAEPLSMDPFCNIVMCNNKLNWAQAMITHGSKGLLIPVHLRKCFTIYRFPYQLHVKH